MNIHTQEDRASVLRYIEQMQVIDVESGLWFSDDALRRVHEQVLVDLQRDVLDFDRYVKTNCRYEPMVGWCRVEFDSEGKVSALLPLDRQDYFASSDFAQFSLVWPNTTEPAEPYTGTWDGEIQDFHQDTPLEWIGYREQFFGTEGSIATPYYRFLKTTLNLLLEDRDGSDCLPEHFVKAAKDAKAWKAEQLFRYDWSIIENVPVRLIMARHEDLKPYAGDWDESPEWEEA